MLIFGFLGKNKFVVFNINFPFKLIFIKSLDLLKASI